MKETYLEVLVMLSDRNYYDNSKNNTYISFLIIIIIFR
jgi:hypothetical protein